MEREGNAAGGKATPFSCFLSIPKWETSESSRVFLISVVLWRNGRNALLCFNSIALISACLGLL